MCGHCTTRLQALCQSLQIVRIFRTRITFMTYLVNSCDRGSTTRNKRKSKVTGVKPLPCFFLMMRQSMSHNNVTCRHTIAILHFSAQNQFWVVCRNLCLFYNAISLNNSYSGCIVCLIYTYFYVVMIRKASL